MAVAHMKAVARLGPLRARAPLSSFAAVTFLLRRPGAARVLGCCDLRASGCMTRALSVAAAGQSEAKMCDPGQPLPEATLIEKHKPVQIK
jgi:hypothetical protein